MDATIMTRPTRRWLKPIYLLLGVGSLAVGIVGVFLPLIPTTGPLLIAAFFFARSSERLYDWLMSHPRLGKFISDFQEGRGIPRRTKVVALIAMTASFTYAAGWALNHPALKALVAIIGVWAIWYVARYPTVPTD